MLQTCYGETVVMDSGLYASVCEMSDGVIMMMMMFGCRNAEMSKELDGSRQTMIKRQTEIDQLQNEVADNYAKQYDVSNVKMSNVKNIYRRRRMSRVRIGGAY